MRLNHTIRCLVGIVLMCSLLVGMAVPGAPTHAASRDAPVQSERPPGPRFIGFATTEEQAKENAYKSMENNEKWHDMTCTPYEERFAEPKGIHFYYIIFAQCTKNELPFRCRNFEETWIEDYVIQLNGGGRQTRVRDFSEAQIWVRACYNGSRVYIEGHRESFQLLDSPQGQGFRPLLQHDRTILTPDGTGAEHASMSSVRVNLLAHFAMPNDGVSFISGSILGTSAGVGFRDNGAEVRYVDYAINIDPHGCYIYTGGGNQEEDKKCPYGRYGGNN